MPDKLPVVAIINTNPDLVALLRFELQRAGFVVVIAHIVETVRSVGYRLSVGRVAEPVVG